MGQITSRGCARNDRITLDFVSCDPVVPGAPTRRVYELPLQPYTIQLYTTYTNLSMKYLVICKVYTGVGGIK